ncbi:MAG: hypothetical protein WB660_19550, partial [Candidatus Sulfotelmatobacter sp.]
RRRCSENPVNFLWILSGLIWEAIEKNFKKVLDSSTQKSEASQGGVREVAIAGSRRSRLADCCSLVCFI